MRTLLLLFLPFYAFAQCTYSLNLNFDTNNQTLNSKVNVYDSSKTLDLNVQGFHIKNKKTLLKAMKNGANKVSFSYELQSKNITQDFIYLLNNWYPKPSSLCQYTIKHNLKKPLIAVYEKTNKPLPAVTFLAAPYTPQFTSYKNITLGTYFFKDKAHLSEQYFQKTIEYIKLYETQIGPFPYKVFNIVQNHKTTGYSLPTYTLIGTYLLNKPYILNRSLGHEIVHQYFGNSVFNDSKQGNYNEGLTTYFSDDYFERLKNKAVQNRKSNLLFYDTFATQEFPANEFEYKKDKNSMAIGYTKTAFIFYMLENKLGQKKFQDLIQKFYTIFAFKYANLKELMSFFDEHTKENLQPFFQQWFFQKGRINLSFANIQRKYTKKGFQITFDVQQKDTYTFQLPVFISTYDEEIIRYIPLSKKEQKVTIYLKNEPLKIVFDKNIELFRELFEQEKHLSIGSILNEPLLLVVDKSKQAQYLPFKKIFKNSTFVNTKELTFDEIKSNNIIFLDHKNTLLNHFFPRQNISKNTQYITLYPHTYNTKKIMGVINIHDTVPRSFYLLHHYSKFKMLIKTQGKTRTYEDDTPFGWQHRFSQKAIVSKVQTPKSFDTLLSQLGNAQVIYASESHTNFTHHLNQLRVIKALYQNNKNMVIGMEMFQTPFQQHVDDYINNKTTLNEFLKRTQYYKNWRYDYDLYKPIIDYAKEKGIQIIALNALRQTVKNVAKKGILATEKKTLPLKIDQSNIQYKEDLGEIFAQHAFETHNKDNDNKQDFFFQSQLIWDETMAQSISTYMRQNPSHKMVVLVGSGHVQQHRGIPQRVFKDTKLPYAVILNSSENAQKGDIVIENAQTIEIPKSIKLGVYLQEEEKLNVLKTIEDSLGKTLGLKKGDKILEVNQKKTLSISDLKRVLYFVKDTKNITLLIERNNKKILLKNK